MLTQDDLHLARCGLCERSTGVLRLLDWRWCGESLTILLRVSQMVDDLSTLKDDMVAFVEGHGMRRFHGYASEDEVQAIMWHSPDHSDGWKDFVELAKHSGAPFLTMHASALERSDLDELVQHLVDAHIGGDDDAEDARWLRQHVGKVGFIQLGWAYQGSMFLYEASTEWYEQYQHLLEFSEDIGGFTLGESSAEDEP